MKAQIWDFPFLFSFYSLDYFFEYVVAMNGALNIRMAEPPAAIGVVLELRQGRLATAEKTCLDLATYYLYIHMSTRNKFTTPARIY